MRAAIVMLVVGCGSATPSTPTPELVEKSEKVTAQAEEPLPGIDARPFLTESSFRPDLPPNAPPGLAEKVSFPSIRLLDPDIGKRLPADLLRAFLELCISSTIASVGISDRPIEVRIHFTSNEGDNTIRIDTKGSPDSKLLGYIYQDLGGMPPLGVTGEIGVQIHARVSGGSNEPWVLGEPVAAPPIEGVYIPANQLPPDPPSQKAKMLYVRLVTPDDELAKRTTPQALMTFIEAVQAHAESTMTKTTASYELTLEMHCTPAGHTMQIGFVGVVDAGFTTQAKALSDAVKAMPKLPTTGDVKFVIGLTIN